MNKPKLPTTDAEALQSLREQDIEIEKPKVYGPLENEDVE